MGRQAQAATNREMLTVIADRGYFKGEEILACEETGMTPRTQTTDVRREGGRTVWQTGFYLQCC